MTFYRTYKKFCSSRSTFGEFALYFTLKRADSNKSTVCYFTILLLRCLLTSLFHFVCCLLSGHTNMKFILHSIFLKDLVQTTTENIAINAVLYHKTDQWTGKIKMFVITWNLPVKWPRKQKFGYSRPWSGWSMSIIW